MNRDAAAPADVGQPWYKLLTRYHWFVLVVAALGWLFDTMDQQLFTLARAPSMNELLAVEPGVKPPASLTGAWGPYVTAVFLMGWATGGLAFGVLGDRIGRAKTMMLTIVIYSIFTGLSAFSRTIWDFSVLRFLTGLGVGGEFAVGVALVAEVMPDRARPHALGWLQALSALGNVSAAIIGIAFSFLEGHPALEKYAIFGVTLTPWRLMFVIGTLPALLALFIRRKLKEPERWQSASGGGAAHKASIGDLFRDPELRRRTIIGLTLATAGVVGLWGIGFFSPDLTRPIFRKRLEEEYRQAGSTAADVDVIRFVAQQPDALAALKLQPSDMIEPDASVKTVGEILKAVLAIKGKNQAISDESLSHELAASHDDQWVTRARELWTAAPKAKDFPTVAKEIGDRSRQIDGALSRWAAYTLIMQQIGAFFGIYSFKWLTQRMGRRPTFALFFVLAAITTAFTFWTLHDFTDIFWMIPVMGFFQLALFGGYAIYFPELFPTRLRSTGTSFCYNVGRFIAAIGPFTFGLLNTKVFNAYPEPMRYSGTVMCLFFLVGLIAVPFAPETKDQPLPE